MALTKLPPVRTPLSPKGIWIVPVSKVLQLGCVLTACHNPSCPCTDLFVSAHSLDERVHAFGFDKGQLLSSGIALRAQPEQQEKPLVLRLDVYTGELSGSDGTPADLRDRRVAAIADALDGETLDALEALWRRQKRIASGQGRRKAQIEPWEPGELVYWDGVFEVDRQEIFVDSGRRVVALDSYCVEPSCDCREVSISFHPEVLPGKSDEPGVLGRVVVTFRGELRFEPLAPESDSRLRALWVRYRRRHPGLRQALERYEQIRAFAAEYTPPKASVLRPIALEPGPNASAPASASLLGSAAAAAPRAAAAGQRDDKAARIWVSTSRKSNRSSKAAR